MSIRIDGKELAGEMGAGADGEEGGGMDAMVVGGREIERDRKEMVSLVWV